MTVTVVNPPKVRLDAPKAIAVVPTVTEELVRLEFAMLVSVLLEPLIVLFVSVCVPVNVATVESIAIVTAEEPLYEVPVNPVPMVKALVAVAVTVTEPPRLTEEPLIVIALLVRLALAMLVSVLVEPLIDLLVSVSVVARPTKVSVLVGRVNVPVLIMVAILGEEYVPPVIVLPVKVRAEGKDRVTVVVPVEVISFAVPLTVVTAPIEDALIATLAAAVS